MDAKTFYAEVAYPNYVEATQHSDDFRRLWNAVVGMNTIAEFVALDRLNYAADLDRETLGNMAADIRKANPPLADLKLCAESLKHVRKLNRASKSGKSTTVGSTAISTGQSSTWAVMVNSQQYDLMDVLHKAFDAIANFPEFN